MLMGKIKRLKIRNDYMAYIYLLPALLLMIVFTVYPIVNTIMTSFEYNYQFLTGDFVRYSARHYMDIFLDPVFRRALYNTLFIAFICVPASMLVALILSLWLNSIEKLKGFYATVFYLPQVTNVIAVGMVFA